MVFTGCSIDNIHISFYCFWTNIFVSIFQTSTGKYPSDALCQHQWDSFIHSFYYNILGKTQIHDSGGEGGLYYKKKEGTAYPSLLW